MRVAFVLIAWIAFAFPAGATNFTVAVYSERAFGYFVGDLVSSFVEISGPAEAELLRASLPHPAPLRKTLDLRDVSVEESRDGATRIWRIRLDYQNFYSALDVRNIEIPGFKLSFQLPGGLSQVNVPAWRFGVAPLREITPEQKERGADYMRPDPAADFVDDKNPSWAAGFLASLTAIFFGGLAWERALPPFHRRSARAFALAARRLGVLARQPDSIETLQRAARELHRAFDAMSGKTVLRPDLDGFFQAHPELASEQAAAERFFEGSERLFFDRDPHGRTADFGLAQLLAFASSLAGKERQR